MSRDQGLSIIHETRYAVQSLGGCLHGINKKIILCNALFPIWSISLGVLVVGYFTNIGQLLQSMQVLIQFYREISG